MWWHAQKPDFVFRRNGRVHLNRRGRQFRRLLATEVCASAVVMLDTPCSEEVWRVLATHSIRQFPLQFHSRASPCAITFQLDPTSLQHTLKQKNHTCASCYKIKITTLFSSPLVTYRPTKLSFQFGEILLTTHGQRDAAHESEKRWLERPCDNEEEFTSHN